MSQTGAPYQGVGGTLITPYGDNGIVCLIKKSVGQKSPTTTMDVSGPSDLGSPAFTVGNYRYSATFIGELVEGTANLTGVTYTHATKTLSKTDAFKYVAVGQYLYVSGGTNATAGWYEIATNADDNTVTLATAPGTGDQSDFTLNGINTTAAPESGPCTIPFGNGERWSGTALIQGINPISDWKNPDGVGVVVSLLFTGAVTITTGLV